jgi:DNA-binding response OmpR family regulator
MPRATPAAHRPPAVLVVEDDPHIAQLLQALLSSAGYLVEYAADGAAALAYIEAPGFDLVLLDLMLPQVSGLEVCRRVRARAGEVYLPIILLTGLASEDDRQAGFAAGADDYVTKPFHAADILARVRVWTRTRQRLVAAYDQVRLAAARAERARLEGVHLAAGTMKDRLTNQLAQIITAAELLAEDPDLPAHVRELASAALRAATEATSTLRQLHRIRCIKVVDWGPGLDPTIDLPRRPPRPRLDT